jgi:hypothetical protein
MSIPTDSSNVKGRCETGHYCPEGSAALTPCPVGTYNDARSSTSEQDCLACPPGYYCNVAGKTWAQLSAMGSPNFGTCTAGYVCSSASTIANPTDDIVGKICPVGHYCPAGTVTEIECPSGSYSPNQGAATCTTCPAGQYCPSPGMSSTITCSAGRYCPSGSVTETWCPYGTYNVNTGSTGSGACTACDATYYCDEEGMAALKTSKQCAAGYICVGRATHAYPPAITATTSINRKCPPGYTCNVGSSVVGAACAAGTYENSYASSACKSCPPGYYCATTGLTAPTGDCSAGYTCFEAATTPNPTDGTKGAVCPIGSYCLAGSAKSFICHDGTKTTATTQSS